MSGCDNTSSSLAPTCGCYRNAPFPGSREGGCGCVSQLLCALNVEVLPRVGAHRSTRFTPRRTLLTASIFLFRVGSSPSHTVLCPLEVSLMETDSSGPRAHSRQQAAGRSAMAPGLFFSSLRSAPSHFKQLCCSVDCRLMIRAGEPVLPPRQVAFHQMRLTPESCCCWVHPSLPALPGLASDLEQVSGAASGPGKPSPGPHLCSLHLPEEALTCTSTCPSGDSQAPAAWPWVVSVTMGIDQVATGTQPVARGACRMTPGPEGLAGDPRANGGVGG